jgi:medium-chain acyl-[acyl-carrier-protein] hydrolase
MIDNKWIVPIKKSNNAKITLLCFHHAGGSASYYRNFAAFMMDEINMYAIQLPGREKRYLEKCIENIDEVIVNLFKNIKSILTNNLIIFGHSLGALIGYEFSKFVYNNKIIIPKHLVVSGRNAPSYDYVGSFSKMTDLDLLEFLKEFGSIPEDLLKEKDILFEFLMPTIRSDCAIADSFKYTGKANFIHPITAYVGKNDKSIKLVEVDNWACETNAKFEKVIFNGDHFYLSENLEQVCISLNQLIRHYI